MASTEPSFVVISGGTGCNAIVGAFSGARTSFIIPISDDGGSSSEVQRVLGGPSIGDIRSRLVRLIPESPDGTPLAAIRTLLEFRLDHRRTEREIKAEWHAIVEGKHRLWKGFSYKRASVGNLFLTGASMFLGSIPSAIFLFASITEIPHELCRVIPVINTSSTATIAAELENGDIIVGQSEISHPSPTRPQLHVDPRSPTPLPPPSPYAAPKSLTPVPSLSSLRPPLPPSPSFLSRAATPSLFEGPILGDEDDEEGYASSNSEKEDRNGNVVFEKDGVAELPSRIKRIFYLNALVYSIGSLYTSLLPCLSLRGVARAIASSPTLKYKILLLNSTTDRETPAYTARDFVLAIKEGLCGGFGEEPVPVSVLERAPDRVIDFVTHVVYIPNAEVTADVDELREWGVVCVPARTSGMMFEEDAVKDAFARIWAGEVSSGI
ncbi:hypothetical protein MNV49_004884 [Pseudohyphozyma bogoriensis]|nr:hypothetical protein MNV49_004884 [Pseudohyphozyma bogoriensis]